jgi:5-formyltetrahydrofolate cyclo-ligase
LDVSIAQFVFMIRVTMLVMPPPFMLPLEPSRDKKLLRRQLQAERQSLIDRHQRAVHLQEVLRVWLVGRDDKHHRRPTGRSRASSTRCRRLYRWSEADDKRRIGLPVIEPRDEAAALPRLVPRLPDGGRRLRHPQAQGHRVLPAAAAAGALRGLRPGGLRLGYGGGFYDRTLAALHPRPVTVGVGYAHGFVPWLEAEAHDVPLDVVLTEDGVHWQRPGI